MSRFPHKLPGLFQPSGFTFSSHVLIFPNSVSALCARDL